jgi:hypothetical protein
MLLRVADLYRLYVSGTPFALWNKFQQVNAAQRQG